MVYIILHSPRTIDFHSFSFLTPHFFHGRLSLIISHSLFYPTCLRYFSGSLDDFIPPRVSYFILRCLCVDEKALYLSSVSISPHLHWVPPSDRHLPSFYSCCSRALFPLFCDTLSSCQCFTYSVILCSASRVRVMRHSR